MANELVASGLKNGRVYFRYIQSWLRLFPLYQRGPVSFKVTDLVQIRGLEWI